MNSAYLAAQLTARRICEETGMSMADVAALPLDEYSRLSGRPTPAEAARAAITAQYEREQRQAPAVPQSPPQAPEDQPQGINLQDMSMDDYAQLRQQLGVGVSQKEGRGIFDSVASQSDVYRNAVRAQAGRTALSNANVEPPSRLVGRTILKQDDHLDHRSAGQRFSTPGNLNQF